MVRWAFIALWGVVIGACYAPHPSPGAPCPDGQCPTGLMCSIVTQTCEIEQGMFDIDASVDALPACPANQLRCDNDCIDPASDPLHCGASGDCTAANSGDQCPTTCSQGACTCPATITFSFTAAMETFVVPSDISSVTIEAFGAQGTAGTGGIAPGAAGMGARAIGTLAVTPGQSLFVFVGGVNGFNGGGAAGTGSNLSGSGGGASDVRTTAALADRVIVAGGGGGGAAGAQGSCTAGVGGTGAQGGAAIAGTNGTGCGTISTGGASGTASAGGIGGVPGSNCTAAAGPGLDGAQGIGGAGGAGIFCNGAGFMGGGGGGGGGGYFAGGGGAGGPGGGGGSWGGAGGGGGASFLGSLTTASTMPGVRTGDGSIKITTICP